jgi:hypothetical protein
MVQKKEPDASDLSCWRSDRLLIEKDEPTALRILDIQCHNEEAIARGFGDEEIHHLWLHQQLAMHFVNLPPFISTKKKREGPESQNS